MPTGHDALRWLGALFATLVMLALPSAFQASRGADAGGMVSAEILVPREGWRPVDLHALKLPKGRISLLRAHFKIPPTTLAAGAPLGLYLSGAFSADAAWNGTLIGSKGRPGASSASETPGPVDVVLPLPAQGPHGRQGLLTLRLSAEKLEAGRSVIHGQGGIFGLRVAPYTADARRPIGYYTAPLLMSGMLLLALGLMASKREFRSPGAVILMGLLVCAAAEISRSIVDYPYPLQALRMSVLKVGAAMVGVGCVLLALRSRSWPAPAAWRLVAAAGAAVLALAAPVEASRLILAGALTGALITGVSAARRRDGELIEQAAALLLMAAFALLPRPDYMDQGLYAASVPLIIQLLWPRTPDRGNAQVEVSIGRLAVGPASARRFLDPDAIRAIHAAGDYVEISLACGRRLLEPHTLSAMAQRLPSGFLRVHRSHIVNAAHAQELRSEGGGRHRLRVTESLWVPVSRTKVSELRRRLQC
jgi:DNA-binding LytR/AlgR family response regulator